MNKDLTFREVMNRLSEEERQAIVNELTSFAPQERLRFTQLFDMQDETSDATTSPICETTDYTAASVCPGTIIDHYELREKLGEGGFGIVFLAFQREPIVREVAFKMLRPDRATSVIVTRFKAEHQTLAILDHSNIVKVLDAGQTDRGRPYFVTELVQGLSLMRYCNDNGLALRERIALFMQVCHAIEHSHHRGIIHRDIKPSNVLVAEQDEKPTAKMIDFGVARLTGRLEQDLLADEGISGLMEIYEGEAITHYGSFVGTPNYMSPEQIDGRSVDIRTDVYSLGAVLFELITGDTPVRRDHIRQLPMSQVARLVLDEAPMKPSERLAALEGRKKNSSGGDAALQICAAEEVRGDLDWIVLKALEKDWSRRYSTVQNLADDLQAFLNNRPVTARPPSPVYRAGKFFQRHRASVLAWCVCFVCVVLGMFGVLATMDKAKRHAADALRVEQQKNVAAHQVDQLTDDLKRRDAEINRLKTELKRRTD